MFREVEHENIGRIWSDSDGMELNGLLVWDNIYIWEHKENF